MRLSKVNDTRWQSQQLAATNAQCNTICVEKNSVVSFKQIIANYTVNLGPVSLKEPGGSTGVNPHNDSTSVFSWNPRLL